MLLFLRPLRTTPWRKGPLLLLRRPVTFTFGYLVALSLLTGVVAVALVATVFADARTRRANTSEVLRDSD